MSNVNGIGLTTNTSATNATALPSNTTTATAEIPPLFQGMHAPLDYNHPLYLSNADVSGITIISFQL